LYGLPLVGTALFCKVKKFDIWHYDEMKIQMCSNLYIYNFWQYCIDVN